MPESTENIRDGNQVHGIIKTISDKVTSCGVCFQPCKGRPSNLRNISRSKRSNNKLRREDIYHYDIDDISTGPQNTTGGGEYEEESTFLINSYVKDGNRSIDDESSTNTQQILTLMPYFWKSHPNSAKKLAEARIKQDLARRKKAEGKNNIVNEIDRDLSSRPSSPLGYENQFGVVFEKMKTESVVVPLYDRDRVNLSHDEYGIQPCDKISYIVKETNDMIADNDNNDPNKDVGNVDEINRGSTKNETEVSDDEGKNKVYNDDLEKIMMKKLQVIDSTFHPSTPKKDLNDNNNDTPTTTASTYDDTALLYSMSSSRLTDEMEEPLKVEASVTDQVPFDEMNTERNVHKTTDKKRFSLASLRRKRRSKDKKPSSSSSKSKKKSSKKYDGTTTTTKAKKSNDLDPPIIAIPSQNNESIDFEQDGNKQIDEPIESPSKISSVPPKTANTSSVQNTIVYDNSVESNSDQWFAFEGQLD